MNDSEIIISLVALVFGTGLIGYIFYSITTLIGSFINRKTLVNSKAGKIEEDFLAFKEEILQRVKNLEAIAADDELHKSPKPLLSDNLHEAYIQESIKSEDRRLKNVLKRERA